MFKIYFSPSCFPSLRILASSKCYVMSFSLLQQLLDCESVSCLVSSILFCNPPFLNKVEHLQVVYKDLHALSSNFPQNIIFSQESSPIPLPSFKFFPPPITQIAYPSLRFQLLPIPHHAPPKVFITLLF